MSKNAIGPKKDVPAGGLPRSGEHKEVSNEILNLYKVLSENIKGVTRLEHQAVMESIKAILSCNYSIGVVHLIDINNRINQQ